MAQKENKFNADSGLGFMRVIQFCNALAILLNLIALIFVSGSKLTGINAFASFDTAVNIVCMGELIWLIHHRKMYTRQIAVVMYSISFIDYIIIMFFTETLTPFLVFLTFLTPGLLSLYFLTSRRAKAVLVQPFDIKLRNKELDESKSLWNPRSLDFWLRLLIYFFAFSVAGHWMEMGVQILVVNGIVPGTVAKADSLTWRDSLNPFFIYGIAVAFCGLALYPVYLKLREKLSSGVLAHVLSFIVNMAFCVVAELILGFLFNADHHAWDYSNQFLNFEGQICLLYSLCFGIFSSVITWFLYPIMERQFSYVSKDMFRAIFLGSALLFVFLYFTYNVDPYDLGILSKDQDFTEEFFVPSTEEEIAAEIS